MSECNDNASVIVLDSFEAIAAAAESPTTFHKATTITLRDCHIDTAAAAKVVDLLFEKKSNLKELIVNKCTGHQLGTILTVALTACTVLESLSIFVTGSRSGTFDPIAHALGVGLLTNKSIKKVELGIGSYSNFFSLTSDAARSLEQGLSGNTSLYVLHVSNCRFEEREALRIFCKGLQSMSSLRNAGFASCYEANGQPLEDQNVACLVRALEQCSDLESLDLRKNKCLDVGMIALASLLDRTPIKKINLLAQQMDRNEFMNTFHLVGALGRTSTLESLLLSSNNLSTDYDMANLAAALTHNTSVKILDLSDNDIRSSAMNILSSRIPSMRVLETLYVDGNYRLDNEASRNLANAMNENSIIRRITCDEHLADYESIRYYADLNWGGRRFIEQQNNASDDDIPSILLSLWPEVLSRICRLSHDCERRANAIYFCLQKGSVVFPV